VGILVRLLLAFIAAKLMLKEWMIKNLQKYLWSQMRCNYGDGAFISINPSLQQTAGGVAAAPAGMIVQQKTKKRLRS
jgi:hypothetical protein